MNAIDEKPASPNDTAEFQAEPGAGERAASNTPAEPEANPAAATSTPSAPANVAKKTKLTDRESLIETVKTVVYALLIALVIRTFLFQPFNIPSGSMEATLLVGDYLFVEKFAYGYSRYSFPWGLGPIPSGRIWQGSGPDRGDVVVFKLPVDNSTDYIKRVIGLPGDHIQLINGQIYLNGKAVPRMRAADYIEDDPLGTPRHIPRYRETLPGGKSYYVLAREPDGPQNNTGVYVVPPGHYFMMGDNRDNSLDSRFSPDGEGIFQNAGGVGYVPAANLVGKAEFVFFSYEFTEQNAWWELLEFWRWPWSVRFSRMFSIID